MRKLVLAAGLALVASGAQAASYLDTFGTVHDPILTTAGGVHAYSGHDLGPGVTLVAAALIGAHLQYADLGGSFIQVSDLSHADLSHARLSSADLTGSTFNYADLSYADMSGTTLTSAGPYQAPSFSYSILTGVDLSGQPLVGVSFFGASVDETNLTGARYSLNASNIADTIFPIGFDPSAYGMIAVPEPSTALFLGIGLVGLAGYRRL